MPDPTPAPPSDLESRIRTDLAQLVAKGPDPATRTHQIDTQIADHRRGFTRRRQFLAGAAATTVAVGAGLTWRLVLSDDGSPSRVDTGGPTPDRTPRSESGWQQIRPAPLSPRNSPAVVWAGDRLIVWGGRNASASPPDGAAWLPAEQQWLEINPAPAGATGGGFAVWDGTEVFVGMTEADSNAPWNAGISSEEDFRYGLAAYDVAKDSWRYVAPLAPDTERRMGSTRQAALVGDRLLVAVRAALPGAGGHAGDIVLVDLPDGELHAVDPGPFAASPYSDASGEVALTSIGKLVVATPNWDLRPWVLDISDGEWRRASAPPGAGTLHLLPATSIGDRAVFLESSGAERWAFDPTGDGDRAWEPLAPNPFPRARWSYDPVWNGTELFVPGAAHNPISDTWRSVVPPPRGEDRQRAMQARWTSDALLLFGGEEYTCPDGADCDRSPGPDTLDGWLLSNP